MQKRQEDNGFLINEKIPGQEVQLIDQAGNNLGAVPKRQALSMADDAGLDLVMIANRGKDGLPVAKIMDVGKALYEKKKQQAEAKKHQKVIQIKEIKMRPKIGVHDYETKINQGISFLNAGKRLKVTVMFRGREMATKEERGQQMFDRVHQTFEEKGLLNSLVQEKDAKAGNFWSRIYYLKGK